MGAGVVVLPCVEEVSFLYVCWCEICMIDAHSSLDIVMCSNDVTIISLLHDCNVAMQ